MTYLFWSFAIVWIALFLYIRALLRRTELLEDEVRRLGGGRETAPGAGGRDGAAAGRGEAPLPAGPVAR